MIRSGANVVEPGNSPKLPRHASSEEAQSEVVQRYSLIPKPLLVNKLPAFSKVLDRPRVTQVIRRRGIGFRGDPS